MDATELRFLLAGPPGASPDEPNPTTWLDDLTWGTTWSQLYYMSKLNKSFEGFDQYFIKNSGKF